MRHRTQQALGRNATVLFSPSHEQLPARELAGWILEDRLAVQRERVRDMERNGELPMAQWEIEARRALASQLASEAPDG